MPVIYFINGERFYCAFVNRRLLMSECLFIGPCKTDSSWMLIGQYSIGCANIYNIEVRLDNVYIATMHS